MLHYVAWIVIPLLISGWTCMLVMHIFHKISNKNAEYIEEESLASSMTPNKTAAFMFIVFSLQFVGMYFTAKFWLTPEQIEKTMTVLKGLGFIAGAGVTIKISVWLLKALYEIAKIILFVGTFLAIAGIGIGYLFG